MTRRVVLAFGTRPEAIKMAPVYRALSETGGLEPLVLLTGQHRTQLAQALQIFDVPAARNLDVMTDRQTLPELAARMLPAAAHALTEMKPDYVLVHGDTITTFVAAWAAFLCGFPVGHVEAGLRSFSLAEPFPEEANRLLTDDLSDLMFAPTEGAQANLLAEGRKASNILVTGQTAVDAILYAAQKGRWPDGVPAKKPLVTVTLHRRENWPVMANLGKAVARLARAFSDWHFVVPLHLNPIVRDALRPQLAGLSNVTLTDPLDYGAMAKLMSESRLLLTDSGGLQEEGASLGVPVAVVRNVTERPEGVASGSVVLVTNDPNAVFEKTSALMSDDARLKAMSAAPNPYGDGHASRRIAEALTARLS